MIPLRFIALPSIAWVLACVPATRAELSFEAGPGRVALVELYTSEGCSSCPPAEAWLSQLRQDSNLWRAFVPVAFHVDYWNQLGWKDPYSSVAFTQRQYAHASEWGTQSVYTPCFIRNGREWSPRSGPGTEAETAGTLRLSMVGPKRWRVSFEAAGPAKSARLQGHVALLAGGITNDVKAGENSGKRLEHDFVAFELRDVRLEAKLQGIFEGEITLSEAPPTAAQRIAAAAWVTENDRLEPLQAVGGWLQ